jgi:hypothetical protein
MTNLGMAERSFSLTALPPFGLPTDPVLPAELDEACTAYRTIVGKHRELVRHLGGHHERGLAARSRDAEALRSGKKPHHEQEEAVDRDRTVLAIEDMQREAVLAEQAVRRAAVETGPRYKADLAERAEQQRQAIVDDLAAVKDRLTTLRSIERHREWVEMASTPGQRVKNVQPDVTGLDAALEPVLALLAEPGERSLADYLASLRPGDSAGPFTVTIPQVVRPTR